MMRRAWKMAAWGMFLVAVVRGAQGAGVEVGKWEPRDFPFEARGVEGNPFEVAFSATVTGADGKHFEVPGFYDGDGVWKVRVAGDGLGRWEIETHCGVKALDGRKASFVCVDNAVAAVHGAWRVDREHAHQFVFEDGTHFFPMGYECDWLWALDVGDEQLPTVNRFLDKIGGLGFNFLILNAYAQDTSWRKGKTGADDFGPPPMYAWEGTNEKPEFSKFNLAYWKHYDRMMEALYRRGMGAHVLMKVYNKQVNWPGVKSAEDAFYFRWLIARYAAYPNVMWDLSKEAQYEKDVSYKTGHLRMIRELDGFHRLTTIHDDKAEYDKGTYDGMVDFRSDQQHKAWRATMLAHLKQRGWPVVNTEFGYECGPGGVKDKTYSQAQEAGEVAQRAWEVTMAGGLTTYYYTYTAWDVLRPEQTPPGYGYFKNLADFWGKAGYWRMAPVEGVASAGQCVAEAGKAYVVFLEEGGKVAVTLPAGMGEMVGVEAEWYQPLTGERVAVGKVGGGVREFESPAGWGKGMAVLRIGG